jgi:acyl dehydratase
MGPDGRLRSFQVQNRSSAFPGDRLVFSGTVRDTRVEGDAGLVELDLRAAKADGELLMPGSAVVELPRRSAT